MPRERANSPSVGEGEIFRHSCGADAEGEIDPLPKGEGDLPSEGESLAKGGTRHPGRVSYTPSCDSP